MNGEISKSKRGPYKRDIHEIFGIWKCLPPQFKSMFSEQLEQIGITDEKILELIPIRTNKEFAEKFGVKDLGTLTDWTKQLENESTERYTRPWSKFFDGSVKFSLYKKKF